MKKVLETAILGFVAASCAVTNKNSQTMTNQTPPPLVFPKAGMSGADLLKILANKEISDVLEKKLVFKIQSSTVSHEKTTVYMLAIETREQPSRREAVESPCTTFIEAKISAEETDADGPTVSSVETMCDPENTEAPELVVSEMSPGIYFPFLLDLANNEKIRKRILESNVIDFTATHKNKDNSSIYSMAFQLQGSDVGLKGGQNVPCVLHVEALLNLVPTPGAQLPGGQPPKTKPMITNVDEFCAAAGSRM